MSGTSDLVPGPGWPLTAGPRHSHSALYDAWVQSLTTDRLVLRPLRHDDLDELAALHAEESFWQYPLKRGQTRAETEDFLNRTISGYASSGVGFHAVTQRPNGALVGWAGLSTPNFLPEILPAIEVGWRLGSEWRGRGYATEAGTACVQWGFEALELDRIVSIYEPANEASGRVMAKLGFELDRIAVHPRLGNQLHVTALTRDRWTRRFAGR